MIAPPGGGNIGDQAMVESYLESVNGVVDVIVRARSDFAEISSEAGHVTFVEMPDLIYSDGPAHLRAVGRFAGLLQDAASLAVVGADIMDGAYNTRASVRRSNLAAMGAAYGVDSRILGFSWNGTATPAALTALKRAGRTGVRCLVRDSVSFDRATRDGLTNLRLAADTVFSLPWNEEPELPKLPDGRLALVNASALIGRSEDQSQAYVALVRHLRSLGYGVVLLPHVIRPNGDDLQELRKVCDFFEGDTEVVLVSELLRPKAVRALCSRSELVVTGRMHLGILALSAGIAPVIFSTQGKVEGVMKLFGLRELVVEPGPEMGAAVVAAVNLIERDHAHYRRLVKESLPMLSDCRRSISTEAQLNSGVVRLPYVLQRSRNEV
ncbi:hypothetical protein GS941_18745 [Rhodococcus hoagii]|nr:hypothetical protein [Prescottella equi]